MEGAPSVHGCEPFFRHALTLKVMPYAAEACKSVGVETRMAECAARVFERAMGDKRIGVSVMHVLLCQFCPEELTLP